MSIYTRTGDSGTTSLFGGERVLKCEELLDVYGSIDELNSWVGHIASISPSLDVKQFLQAIQSDLFIIGSMLAGQKEEPQGQTLEALEERVKEMEARIDLLEKELPPLRNFILPGGSHLGAQAHITRAICRRVERQTVRLATQATLEVKDENLKKIIKYLNRLSDLFFMLARFINKKSNIEEIPWKGTSKTPNSV